jgi:hypothetical protein
MMLMLMMRSQNLIFFSNAKNLPAFYHRHHQLYIRIPRQMGISRADDARLRSSAIISIISKTGVHHRQVWAHHRQVSQDFSERPSASSAAPPTNGPNK